ncbi:MAG TPA: hypothetical protein VEB00_05155 [Clostridia bacterium]|nr:hypothetical protein [Clostridia bacterium]
MARYLITYDLIKPVQNYETFYETIKQLGSYWCHPLESVWLVKTSLSSVDIYNSIKPVLQSDNDLLFIVEITENYYGCMSNETWEHIKNGIFA